jgi:hypothetical protein
MPSTLVPLSRQSAWISEARRAAALSVVKKGLPVPAAKITTRPFSRWRVARRTMKGSATRGMVMAESTRVCTPICSRVDCRARELITVASMPM